MIMKFFYIMCIQTLWYLNFQISMQVKSTAFPIVSFCEIVFYYLLISKDSKKNLIEAPQKCYFCQKNYIISIAKGAELDFFHCKSCNVTSCLIHCAALNKCFCYCETCNIKTEPDWLKSSCRYCPNCKRKFCLLCHDSIAHCTCYCQKCEDILKPEIKEMKDNVCEKCKENCFLCGINTLKRNQIYGKCGHLYCKGCVYEKYEDFRKYNCLKRSY